MNSFQPILIACACAMALAACAATPSVAPQASGAAPPPPAASSGGIQPAAAEASGYGAANTGGTYPYGTIQTDAQKTAQKTAPKTVLNAPQQANTGPTEGIVVMGPDGAVWQRAGETSAAYQGDVDSCYAYARAQIAHDVRIESDVGAAFDSEAEGLGLTALRGRMNNFERSQRLPALFNSCMTAKGYSRQ